MQPLQDLTNQQPTEGHQVLRDFACQNLKTYTEKMASAMIAKSKRQLEYEVGEHVKILIPKIDRFGTDRPVLPCKIIEKLNYNDTFKYRLGCMSGILNNLYCAGELDPLGVTECPELEHIPTDNISVREAARNQSSSNTNMLTGSICKCKSNCNTNKCRCKKSGVKCGSKCHSGKSCNNKVQD